MQTKLAQPKNINTDFEVQSLDDTKGESLQNPSAISYVKFLIMGIIFGVILVKSEVISWYRIQEMFRLQSFHMFGVIGSAVITGMVSILIIKKI